MSSKAMPKPPLARTDDLVLERLPDELLVYDLVTHEAHCLNDMAMRIFQLCDGKTAVSSMVDRLSADLGTAVDESLVWHGLQSLHEKKLLVSLPGTSLGGRRMTRRGVLGRLAKAGGAAILLPVVATISAATPAYAAASYLGTALTISMVVNTGNQEIRDGLGNTCKKNGSGSTACAPFVYTPGATVRLTSVVGNQPNTVTWGGGCSSCGSIAAQNTSVYCTITLTSNIACTISYV